MVWHPMWQHTEGGRHTDDDALALELLGDVDLVARRGLDKLNVGDGIANLDIGTGRRLEGTAAPKARGVAVTNRRAANMVVVCVW